MPDYRRTYAPELVGWLRLIAEEETTSTAECVYFEAKAAGQ